MLLLEFITASAFLSWIGIAIIFLVLTACVEYDRPGWATTFTIGVIAALQFMSPVHPFEWVVHNPLLFVGCVAAYFLVAVGWGFAKWAFFIAKARRAYEAAVIEFKDTGTAATSTADFYHVVGRLMHANQFGTDEALVPQIKKNKARFMTWMVYWPISMVWTVIHDPITRAFNSIYYYAAGTLQRMSNAYMAGRTAPTITAKGDRGAPR